MEGDAAWRCWRSASAPGGCRTAVLVLTLNALNLCVSGEAKLADAERLVVGRSAEGVGAARPQATRIGADALVTGLGAVAVAVTATAGPRRGHCATPARDGVSAWPEIWDTVASQSALGTCCASGCSVPRDNRLTTGAQHVGR